MAPVLASYGSALVVERLAGLRLDIVIWAIVLTMTLARIQRSAGPDDRLAAFVLLPGVAVVAWGVGYLMSRHPDAGDALFVAAMAGSVWGRRLGVRAGQAARLIVSPLIAVLIVGAGGPGQAGVGWVALIALVACGWVTVFGLLAARAGLAAPGVRAAAAGARGTGRGWRRPRSWPASTRMALQLGVALGAAFVLGRIIWPDHWAWVVLTAFLVCSGARGRGDVLLKGVLRVAGAAAGTAVAAGIAGTIGPRADVTVVLMFVALAVATWLREYSYAYWAGIITAVLSLLYGWFGQSPDGLLQTRLLGILLGAALGIGASWLILPVRTGDVLRRRSADAVAAIGAVICADRDDHAALRRGQAAFERSVLLLDQIAQPLRAQRLLLSRVRPGGRYGADAIDAIAGCAEPVRVFAQAAPGTAGDQDVAGVIGAMRGSVTAARLAIGRRPGTPHPPVRFPQEAGEPAVIAALRDIDRALGTVSATLGG
jgi:Fusaric acid resistance protein-like